MGLRGTLDHKAGTESLCATVRQAGALRDSLRRTIQQPAPMARFSGLELLQACGLLCAWCPASVLHQHATPGGDGSRQGSGGRGRPGAAPLGVAVTSHPCHRPDCRLVG